MPSATRAARTKKEVDDIDLSFLEEDEDILALQRRAASKGKAKAAPSASSRRTAAGATGPRSMSASGSRATRGNLRRADDEDDDQDEQSDDDLDIDDIIASMNGGNRSVGSRGKNASKAKTSAPPRPSTRINSTRSQTLAVRTSGRRAPPRQCLVPLSNAADSDSDLDDGEVSGQNSDDLQEELDDLNDELDDDDGVPRRSTRRTQEKGKARASSTPAKSSSRTATKALTRFIVDDDSDDDDDDFGKRAQKNRAGRTSKRDSKRRSRTEQYEDKDEDENDDSDGEAEVDDQDEEEDELEESDADYGPKRKTSTASRSAPKRQRLTKASSKPRGRPRRKTTVTSTRRKPVHPQKMRFALQSDLPVPHIDPPTSAEVPVIEIDQSALPDDLTVVPTLDDIEPIYSPSELSDVRDDDGDDDDDVEVITDAESDSSVEEAEPYQAPEAPIDKHWPACKRCNDGPALPLYNKALSQLKRATKREANRLRNRSPERVDSRGRLRKNIIDDSWGKLTAVQAAEEWIEAARRHRSVFGESAPAPSPVRYIDIDEVVDTESCPDCVGYASYCTLCKSNVSGERSVQEQLSFSSEMLEQYPDPPAELTASRMFRCKRCSRATHYECLARSQTDGDRSRDHTAESVQEAGWLCTDCQRWPAVDQIIAWRQLDRRLWNDEEAKRADYATLSPRESLPREYLVEFKDKSFRETEWVPHDWLRILHQTLLHHFLAKGSRLELEPAELIESASALNSARRNRASLALGGGRALPSTPVRTQSVKKTLKVDETGEVDVGPPGPVPDAQRRIPKPWKTPDRILAVKYYFSVQKEGDDEDEIGGNIIDSDVVHLDKLEPSDYLRSWMHKVTFPALTAEEKRAKRERRLAKSGSRFRALDDQAHCIEGGDLIDFQLEGVNWLRYGWYHEKPGILADEMGLGKTVQIITFLASIWKEGRAGPFLVVVPNSTLPNWMREFEKWMPQFRVVPFWGEGEARDMISRYEFFHSKKTLDKTGGSIRPIKFHVVVAAEVTVRLDSLPLRKVESWDVIIVDEGQNLKSGKSLLLKRLNELHAEHRIIMTGTPLNNNVAELFNLLNWLEPGGQWKDVKALEAEYSVLKPEVTEELQKRLRPYFLRRLKKEVLDLPLKIELIVPTSLRPIQKRIYRSILESNIEDIQALSASRETGARKGKKSMIANLNNTLMQLRKCIQHPYLIAPDLETREGEENYEATWEHQRLIDASAKLSLLQRLLPKLKAEGHRILLFSQFVINLDIVEVFLRGEGYKFLRLDGEIGQKQRQKGIDAFNAPDSPYFIYMISTRAGGVGINLATADTVIIMDPDWNPHVDMQAIARAHRIGQTKKLLVFTLMCKATAEERIIQAAKRKMMLDHLIVQNLDKEDETPVELESILKFGSQALFAEGGTEESERDVRYSDEDLDSLLRRREDAVEDDDKIHEVDAEQGGGPKETFSFARVWESDRSEANADGVAPTTVVDDDFWADLLEKHREDAAERAAEAHERETQEKRASRRDRIKAMLAEDERAEASSVPAKRGPGRPKKVPKPVVDEDFTVVDEPSDDEDHELIDAVLAEDEMLPAVQALRKRQIKSSNAAIAAAAAAAAAAAKATAPVPAPSVPADPTALYAASTSAASALSAPTVAAMKARPATAAHAAKPAKAKKTAAAAALAASKKSNPSAPSFASLQRDLIAEHRLPRPAPLGDLDLSLPISEVRPGHLAAMRRVMLSMLHDSDFALEIADRSQSNAVPQLSPPHMRFQLTDTHINYYMQSFNAPRTLFEAAFSIIAEENVPAEILALPHGGAIALDWRRIQELLLRTATYMVMALRRPKSQQPWARAIAMWNKSQAGRPAAAVIDVADSPEAATQSLPPPAPTTPGAAVDVLRDSARREAWVAAVAAHGDADLTKVAQLVNANPLSTPSPNLVLMMQNFMDGKGAKPAYGPSKLSIRAGTRSDVFVDPDVMPPPTSTVSARSAGLSTSTQSPSQARPNRVAAALSRLSAFSGGSPARIDVSKKELSKLNVDVAVNFRKVGRPKSSRSSIGGGSPRSSIGPSPSPSLHGMRGDSFPPPGSLDGDSEAMHDESFVISDQTCIIGGGPFHYLNRCPEMEDVTRASTRWFQLCEQLRILAARGRTDGDPDVATIKTTIKVMARKLNGLRSRRRLGPLVPPFA
ncbi:hypothetical protein PHSY_007091 [Pseudozyma hubeiensis SY62]|uniref:Uncharacterized protein n=1 Tax=Pseudozyma hubeiensis (strain SY62) TaxID=1305764 RepID=R9PDN8_PSEHS|nr:hypothetical protein PHSY_007091 [Pseudozyma hubeiensis SY62]GAC99489.1 hypothetical protein PHSY_007091 [Pseudozyma hubeiensis SY62]